MNNNDKDNSPSLPRVHSFSRTISALRLLGALELVGEAELGPILARHQVVVHAAAEVLLGDVAAHRVLIAILGQAAHVPDHGALATAFMVQRKAAALRRRRREQPLRERVRGHNTPLDARKLREDAKTPRARRTSAILPRPPQRFAILADRDPHPRPIYAPASLLLPTPCPLAPSLLSTNQLQNEKVFNAVCPWPQKRRTNATSRDERCRTGANFESALY